MVSNGHLMTIWITGSHEIEEVEKSRFWGESLFGRKYGKLPRYFDVTEVRWVIRGPTFPADTGLTHLLGGLSPN